MNEEGKLARHRQKKHLKNVQQRKAKLTFLPVAYQRGSFSCLPPRWTLGIDSLLSITARRIRENTRSPTAPNLSCNNDIHMLKRS